MKLHFQPTSSTNAASFASAIRQPVSLVVEAYARCRAAEWICQMTNDNKAVAATTSDQIVRFMAKV